MFFTNGIQGRRGDLYTELGGEYHSFDDKPAMIYPRGDKYGRLHRGRGLPIITDQVFA